MHHGMEGRGVNKFRPPLAVLLAIAITLVALGIGGWWWLQRQSPLQLQHQSLKAPITSRFLPRSANLSVVLELDPALLPAYGRAVAPAKQRNTTARPGRAPCAGCRLGLHRTLRGGPNISQPWLESRGKS